MVNSAKWINNNRNRYKTNLEELYFLLSFATNSTFNNMIFRIQKEFSAKYYHILSAQKRMFPDLPYFRKVTF